MVVNIYLIVVYDVAEERVGKINSYLKRYLFWRQNSVFEGELSISQLEEMKSGIFDIIDPTQDSIMLYILPAKSNITLEIIGIEKNNIDMIL